MRVAACAADREWGTMVAMNDSRSVRVVEAVVKHRRMIMAYANAIVRDFHLAEDVYQEVALVVAKNEDRLPPDDQMIPWMREIARRLSLAALRKRQKSPLSLPEETLTLVAEKFESERDESDEPSAAALQKQRMQECVNKLKGTARQVIEIRYGGARPVSCEDIAVRMNRSVKAVYGIMNRARLALTNCVEQTQRREKLEESLAL